MPAAGEHPPMRIAAVTMVYDEPDFLPLWAAYYGGQLGAAQCYVIDHGSDETSMQGLGAINRLRLPRSPQDDPRRARAIGQFCAALLAYYDAVIHTDVDEFLLPDPYRHASLAAACAASAAAVTTAIGLNLHHLPDSEPSFDAARPVLHQRRWVRFAAALCKPALIRRPVVWAPGFHCADAPLCLGDLFLLHLRWFDRDIALRRLAKTRAMPWADPAAGAWQRGSDAELLADFERIAGLARSEAVVFDPDTPPLSNAIERLQESAREHAGQPYAFDLDLAVDELWSLPLGFANLL